MELKPRALALKLIGQVKGERKPIDYVLRQHPQFRKLDARDQSHVRALVTHVFRHHHALDAAFSDLLTKPLESLSPAALGPLRLGTAELLVLGGQPHAVLNETVSLAPKSLRGLVNAVLRGVVRDFELASYRLKNAVAVPPWMIDVWEDSYGKDRANDLALGLREVPDLDITLKPKASFNGGESLLVHHRRMPACDPRNLPGFEDGNWWVQDLAASLPVRLLGDLQGRHVLDVCAAPGGKTMQLSAAGADVTALDVSETRLKKVQSNLERTGLSAKLIREDARKFLPKDPFDLIVLDAPCSASGTIRRHPEWPWIHSRKDQLENVPIQAALLRRAINWLKPEGLLVYAVCSLFPEEGEMQIEAFLEEAPEFQLITPTCTLPPGTWSKEKGWLRTTPNTKLNLDGFFAAVLKKVN